MKPFLASLEKDWQTSNRTFSKDHQWTRQKKMLTLKPTSFVSRLFQKMLFQTTLFASSLTLKKQGVRWITINKFMCNRKDAVTNHIIRAQVKPTMVESIGVWGKWWWRESKIVSIRDSSMKPRVKWAIIHFSEAVYACFIKMTYSWQNNHERNHGDH